MIITRRDDNELNNVQLIWEDEQIILGGFTLEQASEQIDLRLDQIASASEADSEEAKKIIVETVLDSSLRDEELRKILALNKEQLKKINGFLSPLLTSNPFVNVRLLHWRLLNNLDSRDLLVQCQIDLLLRSGFLHQEDGSNFPTIKQAQEILHELITHLDNPDSWTIADYQGLLNDRVITEPFESLEPFFQTGILRQISGQPLYKIDDALCKTHRKLNALAV